MVVSAKVLSPQEQRIMQGELVDAGATIARTRVGRMLKSLLDSPITLSVDRARLYTESFRETEGLPIEMRMAKALEHTMTDIDIAIRDEELIVGDCSTLGRYGVLYPEMYARWFKDHIEELGTRREGAFSFTQQDLRVIREIEPYWKGKNVSDAYFSLLPEDVRRVVWQEDGYDSKGVINEQALVKGPSDWAVNHEKVLRLGYSGIKREVEERLAALDPLDPESNFKKLPFLKAVSIVCDAMITFARRYAELAGSMAERETDDQRKRELLQIAEVCSWVPANPARTFHEALQSVWFTRVGICFEQDACGIGLGRMDQYLYPYYEKDLKEGRITRESALELLHCLWLNLARYKRLYVTGMISSMEGYPHHEQVTIGGQTRDGQDATNELSYLILQTKIDFPLDYPDVLMRVHSRTPQPLLMKACECVKQGTGFPKFLNDEEIIPLFLSKGATWEEARDYNTGGCIQARLPNLETCCTPNGKINLAAALEMALSDGVFRLTRETLGVRTGDPRGFGTFDDVVNAYRSQVENLVRYDCIRQTIVGMVRQEILAAPLLSCLSGLLMEQCVDVHSYKVKGGYRSGPKVNVCGFGTVVDSLAAIKKLVYDDKAVTMAELLEALETNFEGNEPLRQMCLNTPKYGNNDPYVDSIGCEIEGMLVSFVGKQIDAFGFVPDVEYIPTSAHVSLGAAVGATPNGRKAKEPLSEGISPSQGCDVNGPTSSLLSVANTRNRRDKHHGAMVLNMKFSPQAVAGEEGTRNLAALVRTWCDLRLWHIQFNVVNVETLREAQKHPEKYRNLLVRVAGYSAYFVDLSPGLQEDIIRRTEHNFMA